MDRYLCEFAYPFGVVEAIGVTAYFAHVTFADCTDTSVHRIDAFAVRHLDEWCFVVAAAKKKFKFLR